MLSITDVQASLLMFSAGRLAGFIMQRDIHGTIRNAAGELFDVILAFNLVRGDADDGLDGGDGGDPAGPDDAANPGFGLPEPMPPGRVARPPAAALLPVRQAEGEVEPEGPGTPPRAGPASPATIVSETEGCRRCECRGFYLGVI